MTIFTRAAGFVANAAKLKTPRLTREQVAVGFELILGRRPSGEGEMSAALRLAGLPDLVAHLLKSEEFRDRYRRLADAPAGPLLDRRQSVFLGDRVLCWTHRGQPIYVVPQDVDLTPRILRDGAWERHVEETMLRFVRPGDTVIDVGSNVGYYTIILGAAVHPGGKVYAFEAHPGLVRLLNATIHVNGFGHLIELHGSAVSDCAGTLELAVSVDHYGSGNLVPTGQVAGYDEGYPQRIQVLAVTLDATLGDRVGAVDLMHLDIEGSEPLALRGAEALIGRSPAIRIITEWSVHMMGFRADVADYAAWLAGLGFRFWLIDRETAALSPVEPTALASLPHCDLLLSRQDPL